MNIRKQGSEAVMKDVVHIIGHKNPDTDSIVSAIAYAQLKQKLGINAIACRLGELNPETDFVLKKFQVPEPVYIQNARVKLYDVPFDEPLLLKKDDTIKEAWDRMGMRSTSALFVVDEAQKLIGVVSLSDMTNILMSDKGEKPISLMKNTSCENIRKVLQGEFLYECDAYRTNGRIHILCSRNEEYSDISYRDSIVVVNDDLKLQKRALSDGAGCMILVDVDIISQGIIRMAKEANCTIIKTPLNMFQVARSMYRSPSVKLIMKRKIISFNNHAYIDDVYKQMSKSRFRSYPVVNNQGVVLGSISPFSATAILTAKHRSKVVQHLHHGYNQQPDYQLCRSIVYLICKMKKYQSQICYGRTGEERKHTAGQPGYHAEGAYYNQNNIQHNLSYLIYAQKYGIFQYIQGHIKTLYHPYLFTFFRTFVIYCDLQPPQT